MNYYVQSPFVIFFMTMLGCKYTNLLPSLQIIGVPYKNRLRSYPLNLDRVMPVREIKNSAE